LASVTNSVARATGLSQQPDDLGAQLTARHRVDRGVDGLVTDVAIRVAGIHASKYAGADGPSTTAPGKRRAYGLRDEEYLRLKVLTCMLRKH
jgi:hypothetical protein